ncbi:MAG: hypothetical protein OEU80_11120 [Deltaproteobacteria bacterium]|nr:hypothetical protein [Deltaproteobacteria bacterium]
MIVLPGVLGGRALRRTDQVRLGSNPLRLPGGTSFSTASRRQFVKYPGWPPGKRDFQFSPTRPFDELRSSRCRE